MYSPKLICWYNNLNNNTQLISNINNGIILSSVYKKTLLHNIGCKNGDILLSINNKKIDSYGYIVNPFIKNKNLFFLDYICFLEIEKEYEIWYYSFPDNSIIKKQLVFPNKKYFNVFEIMNIFFNLNIFEKKYECLGGLIINNLYYDNWRYKRFNHNKKKIIDGALVIYHVFPGTSWEYDDIFDWTHIIYKINDNKIKNFDDFYESIKKSVKFVKIVTINDTLDKFISYILIEQLIQDFNFIKQNNPAIKSEAIEILKKITNII